MGIRMKLDSVLRRSLKKSRKMERNESAIRNEIPMLSVLSFNLWVVIIIVATVSNELFIQISLPEIRT